MTQREVANERKNDANVPSKPGPVLYRGSVGTDASEGSEDCVIDFGSESDESEIDKNNNHTPLTLPGFHELSRVWNFQSLGQEHILCEDVMSRSMGQSSKNTSMAKCFPRITCYRSVMIYLNKIGDSQYGSARCVSSEEILSRDEGRLLSSSEETDNSDGGDFTGDFHRKIICEEEK